LAVNVAWWNEHFAAQAESLGLTEAEAESVFLHGAMDDVDARFTALVAKIAESAPERASRIQRLLELKVAEALKK
jgi:hypothetical protein